MSRLLTYGLVQLQRSKAYLLESYPGASVAYSLRKIKVYSGYCIKVRRSSDDATQDIGFKNGVLDEDALLAFVGANDGFIETWYDQSGNGNNVVQGITTRQPKIVSSGTLITDNGKPSVLFTSSNTNCLVASSAFDISDGYWLITSILNPDISSIGNSFAADDLKMGIRITRSFQFMNKYYAYTYVFNDSNNALIESLTCGYNSGKQSLFTSEKDSVTLNGYFNGFNIASLDYAGEGENASLKVSMGCYLDPSNNPSEPYNGYISEIIMWGFDNSVNRINIESNIRNYYQLQTPSLLCDYYSGAALIYSLRKLRSDYYGYCIKVRRSSDNTLEDIGFDANGVLDESALTEFVGSDSAFIHTWYDQAGTSNAVNTTDNNQPRIVNSGTIDKEGGIPNIIFDGLNDILISGYQNLSTIHAFVAITKTSATNGSNFGIYQNEYMSIGAISGNNWGYLCRVNEAGFVVATTGYITTPLSTPSNNTKLLCYGSWDGTGDGIARFRRNGVDATNSGAKKGTVRHGTGGEIYVGGKNI